jgi:hypothetical protein
MSARARFRGVAVAAALAIVLRPLPARGAGVCASFSVPPLSAAAPSGAAAGNCSSCVSSPSGCGFCLQTLACAPLADALSTCRDALALAPAECGAAVESEAGAPACAAAATCGDCVEGALAGACAWCGAAAACMPAADAAAVGCAQPYFDAPCPADAAAPTPQAPSACLAARSARASARPRPPAATVFRIPYILAQAWYTRAR